MRLPQIQNYPSRKGVMVIFILTVLLYVSIGYLTARLFGRLAPTFWELLIAGLVLPLPAYIYLRRHDYDVRVIFRLNLVSNRIVALSVALGLASFLLANEIDRLIAVVLPLPEDYKERMYAALIAQNWLDWILAILAVVVLPGIFEEMVLRGFVQNTFEQYHKVLPAIAITAAIFAAMHGLLSQIVQIFLLGVFLGWLAWKSESIIPAAIVHAINNLLSLLLVNIKTAPSWLIWQGNASASGDGHVNPYFLLAAGGVIYFGFRLFNRFCEEEIEIPTFFNTPV
ncbi:CPBP family intramembrane metalloprotease [candidate division KSB1 bacterium]|nr:CPBP family intramembrane metalloprotease [candidate division KSB1 bacterium]